MSFGKTIRLFLVEGSPNGMITAELSNWTGKAFKIPRIKVKDYLRRDELHKAGVYILFGKNENNEDAAYIGEGEPVIDRIKSHDIKKDFWNEVILFVSKDDYLNKASIKYLENRLHNIGQSSRRYDVSTQNTPTKSSVSEAEKAELEEFLANIKLLTATLGHRMFEEITETVSTTDNQDAIFYCKNASGVTAKGSPSTEGFIVFNNSQFVIDYQSSLPESIRNERTKMLQDGILIESEEYLKLTRDYSFSSPSRAAAMILGRSARGPVEWKTERGLQLNQYEVSGS
ncbi:GIY-YIG nuclease family protein [Mucilaginibacter sp. RS28]|uniref:GIY-YIG nuclease family protein n=1 Tax=Mucilaginibacter straminoryzae TaxID=2932774 RepID=A0A9X1X786_9SPHI|nr:GIY-YIG nuclease family protein [Mucilaginibacter straminoryzae]MCJ8209944.1 GIY-YIG nuclease family protein [Mucilaginibacter straminoryzae]